MVYRRPVVVKACVGIRWFISPTSGEPQRFVSEGRVLWDDDWEMVDHLDAAPEVARRIKAKLGILDDYFVAIPRDPSDAEVERLLAELMTLTTDAR